MINTASHDAGNIDVLASRDCAGPRLAGDLPHRVKLFLATSNVPGLRQVRVDLRGDAVVLTGGVRTFYEKQLAALLCRRVAGVIRLVDEIEVRGYTPRPESDRPQLRRIDAGRSNVGRSAPTDPRPE